MPNRWLRFSMQVAVALAVGCGTDEASQPTPPVRNSQVFTALGIFPTASTLSTVAPGDTLQLTIHAYDAVGSSMSITAAATYSSSAPAIASVSKSGIVQAAAPGTARITAVLTLGGVTLTAAMTVRVHSLDYSDVTGVYDLTAIVTSFDPVWGDIDGSRYEAVVTLSEENRRLSGTYRMLRWISPGTDSVAYTDSGNVTPFYDSRGVLIIALGARNTSGLTLIVATLAPGFINGTFGCCGHISGTFEARRRQQ